MRIATAILFTLFVAACSDGATTDTPIVDASDTSAVTDTSTDAPITCGSPCATDPTICQAQIGGRAYCDTTSQTCACPP